MAKDGMTLVRAELARRIDALEARLAARGPIGMNAEAASIAGFAGEYGLVPVQRLGEGLAVALGEGGRGAAIRPWLELMRDSIGCEAMDERAATGWLASVMVRLAG
jgi:hypothetical protein